MLDSKFFFTLVGLVVAVFAICNTNMSQSVSEGFWNGPSRTVKVMREVHPNKGTTCGAYSLQNNYQSMSGNNKFVSTPNFQGLLSPRFGNTQFGANIRYNMPSYDNMGVPCNPLGMADMVKESYKDTKENFGCSKGRCGGGCRGGCGVASCGKGGVSLDGSVSPDSHYNISSESNYSNLSSHVNTDGLVPVGDMTTIDSEGVVSQPIIYDRMIYANRKSRTQRHGDLIRGDLNITPDGGNWFSVHPHPSIDLHQGAMNVMGGVNNENTRALGELQYATSGGYATTIAGVNMANEYSTSLSASGGDLQITAFP